MNKLLPAPLAVHITCVPPKPGCKIKVIGAGMPRTGTNSFCAAVSHLLDGPSYHVGVQTTATGDESHVRNWISILRDRPHRTGEDKKRALQVLSRELDGYVMATDPPIPQLVPELLELYPDAIVIVTLRDKKTWAVSFAKVIGLINVQLMAVMFFWIRNLRLAPSMWTLFGAISVERYGAMPEATEASLLQNWNDHMDFLEEHVPKEKLFYFDVKDGWAPLCEILDVPIPEDMPFPRLNDAKAIETAFKTWSFQGLSLWVGVVSVSVALSSVSLYLVYQRM